MNNICGLNFSNASYLPIEADENTSLSFSIDWTGILTLSGTFRLVVSEDQYFECLVENWDDTGTINVIGDIMYVDITILQNLLIPNKTYFYGIRNDVDADHASILVRGPLMVKPAAKKAA